MKGKFMHEEEDGKFNHSALYAFLAGYSYVHHSFYLPQ